MENGKYFKNNELIKADYIEGDIKDVKLIGDAVEVMVDSTSYSFTPNEYKLLNTIFYYCQFNYENKNENFNVEGYKVAEISSAVFKSIFKDNHDGTLKNFENTLLKFKSVNIKLKAKKYKIVTSLLPKYIVKNEGHTILCCIDKDIYKIIMSYKEDGYSPLDVKMLYNAKGLYTQYLYENLRVWSGTKKEIVYTVDELKIILKATHVKSYNRYCDFKKYALLPAVNEINEKFTMEVDYKENKLGRTVQSITFIIKDNEPRVYTFGEQLSLGLNNKKDFKNEDLTISENIINKIKKCTGKKLAIKTIDVLLNIYGEELMNEAIDRLESVNERVYAPKKWIEGTIRNIKIEREISVTGTKRNIKSNLKSNNFVDRYELDPNYAKDIEREIEKIQFGEV